MKRFLAVATVAAIFYAPLASADSGVTAVYNASPDELWAVVDFHQPSENIMPPIASSVLSGEGVGATKINTLAEGGGEIHLLLVYYEPERRAFNYVIQAGPLPVKNYVGEVRVADAGEGRAQLSWRGIYDADGVTEQQADEILGGFYASIADKIGQRFTRVK